jgi:hypothetical protein
MQWATTMKVPISLARNVRLESRLFSRAALGNRVAWVHLAAQHGKATLKVTDGAAPIGEQVVSAPSNVATPSNLSSALISNGANAIVVEIIAGADGFRGELIFDGTA